MTQRMGENSVLLLINIAVLTLAGAEVPTQQVVPQGIQSVNGSDITMGCASPLVDRSGVMVCNNSESYLVDGCSPAIDTSTSNWASQLVTVRKKGANGVIDYEHVLLTFVFDTAVSLNYIELDMFLCPEWGIGSRFIWVFAEFVFSHKSIIASHDVPDSQSSCDSLLTVNIPLGLARVPYTSWHIVVEMEPEREWFHVGEVRFLPSEIASHAICSSVYSPSIISSTSIPFNTSSSSITSFTSATAIHAVSVNSSPASLSTSVPVTTYVISSIVYLSLSNSPTSSESLIMSPSGIVTIDPIPTSKTVPNSGAKIVAIVVGAFSGLILCVIIGSCCFKHYCSSKSDLNNPKKLQQYRNRSDPFVEVNDENCRNDYTFYELGYQPTEDDPHDSCLEVLYTTEDTCPTDEEQCYAVQPTAPPTEEVIYDNPRVFRGGDSKESVEKDNLHVIDPIYDVPKVLPKGLQQPVEITSDNITEIRELGNGNFGKVMLAATRGMSLKDLKLSKTDDNRDISILVAVKMLIDNPSKTQRESFMKEVKFMSSLKHQNVVSLIGVCYDEPGFMMMEYMKEGDLSQFLQRYTEIVETPSNKTQISTSSLVYMASQIASAMKYLASLNFIHRDIASRNCLVGNEFSVKLADFGMSQKLYESHYYRMQRKSALPIRWMATECFYGQFSEKSDVWAFGVTMWELFILAKESPYSNFSDKEVINDATKGAHRQLLPRPSVCPVPVYNIMKRCWAIDPKERANFYEIEGILNRYLTST